MVRILKGQRSQGNISAKAPSLNRRKGSKALNTSAEQTEAAAAIRKIAYVIEEASAKKNAFKERQLRFAYFNTLTNSKAKTKLLLQIISAEQNKKENSSFPFNDKQRPVLVESGDRLSIENLMTL